MTGWNITESLSVYHPLSASRLVLSVAPSLTLLDPCPVPFLPRSRQQRAFFGDLRRPLLCLTVREHLETVPVYSLVFVRIAPRRKQRLEDEEKISKVLQLKYPLVRCWDQELLVKPPQQYLGEYFSVSCRVKALLHEVQLRST